MLWYHLVLSVVGILTNGSALVYIKKKFDLKHSANYLMWLSSLSSTVALVGFLPSGFLEQDGQCFTEALLIAYMVNGWIYCYSLNAWCKYKKISTSISQHQMTWKSDRDIIRMGQIGVAVLALYFLTIIWANAYFRFAAFPSYDECMGIQNTSNWLFIPSMVFLLSM